MSGPRPPRRRRWRAAAAGAILTCAAASALALEARARAGELAEQAFAHVRREVRHGGREAADILRINGLPLRIRSGVTRQSVRALLDGFETRCGLRPGSGWLSVLPLRSVSGALAGELLRPVLRAEREDGGYLACLDLRAQSLEPGELLQRVHSFATAGDLAALGDLRLVWAWRKRGETAYVAVWSEGPIRLAELFPARGDAPGLDLHGVPRPPRGRRVLSAWQEQRAPMLAAYRVELPPSELATRYRRALIDGGFAVRGGGGPQRAPRWLLADRDGAFTAIAMQDAGAGRTFATLLPLR